MHAFKARDAHQARGFSSAANRGFRDRGFAEQPPLSPNGDAGETRLADKLYELSLEAEDEAKQRKRQAALQADALRDCERERDRLREQLEEARTEARTAYTAAASARGAARDREEEYIRECVVLRAELADARQRASLDPVYSADLLLGSSTTALENYALVGDETGLRAALSPECVGAAAYNALLFRLLLSACKGGKAPTCKLLLRRGALAGSHRDAETGWSALHAAAHSGNAELVEVILADDVCAPRPSDESNDLPDPLDVGDSSGRTALMLAAERGHADVVRALMRAGADAEVSTDPRLGSAAVSARALARPHALVSAALDSAGERFWNASAAGNRAWRRKDFGAALQHFSSALKLESALKDPDDSPPNGVDLARLELNCAKAALRMGKAIQAADRADRALDRHRRATRGSAVYANALAVRAECREAMYDFAGAAADFDHLAGISDAAPGAKLDEVRSWQDRSRRARDLRDATHYAVLGLQQRADDAEIRRAYRKASMRWHPDRQKAEAPAVGEEEQSSSVFAEERARAEGHFRRINEAKETLLDSYKRAVYDVEARRRIAAEAEDAQWPWLSPKQPMAQPAAQTGIVVHNGLRVTRAWVPPARKQAPAASPAASPMKAEAKAEAKVDAEVPPAAPPARPMPATPVAADVDADADVRVSSSADSAVGEGDDDDAAQPEEREWSWRLQKYEDELRRQRDELEKARAARAVASDERQRQEALAERLETEVAAAKLRAERRAADLGTATPRESSPRARRFADADSADADSPARWPRNAGDSPPRSWRKDDGAASDDSEDYDVRSAASAASGASDASSSRTPSVGDAASPAGAAPADAPVGGRSSAFFAPKAGRSPVDFEDDFCDDNTTPRADSPAAFGDGEAKGFSDDLMAQLRDAAEWFDHLDSERRGELDMAHFDELTTHLGLGDVLGDDEMRRQRYFADPVGSGRLRRGTFLGWFAALLEGKGNLKGAL